MTIQDIDMVKSPCMDFSDEIKPLSAFEIKQAEMGHRWMAPQGACYNSGRRRWFRQDNTVVQCHCRIECRACLYPGAGRLSAGAAVGGSIFCGGQHRERA